MILFYFTYSVLKNGQPQNGPLWPPFRPLKQLSEKFSGLKQIFHSKKLHGVLFFIFYKVITIIILPVVSHICIEICQEHCER